MKRRGMDVCTVCVKILAREKLANRKLFAKFSLPIFIDNTENFGICTDFSLFQLFAKFLLANSF